ncbi:MAG: hypothetical protein BAJALOKI3v1_160057 [Promethearchaeota archaeon]|nr:MAG: hypothetical protein BAJALOKI3v1_160057 [Candidatus Lokiarchaeota archaeon]
MAVTIISHIIKVVLTINILNKSGGHLRQNATFLSNDKIRGPKIIKKFNQKYNDIFLSCLNCFNLIEILWEEYKNYMLIFNKNAKE